MSTSTPTRQHAVLTRGTYTLSKQDAIAYGKPWAQHYDLTVTEGQACPAVAFATGDMTDLLILVDGQPPIALTSRPVGDGPGCFTPTSDSPDGTPA